MVARRVELQEAVEKLPEIIFRVYLVLQNHLKHGMPKVQVRVAGVLLHRHALAANPAEPLDGRGALGDGPVVGKRSIVVGVWGECGGGGVFVVGARRRVVVVVLFAAAELGGDELCLGTEYVEELWSSAAAAAYVNGCHSVKELLSGYGRHCWCESEAEKKEVGKMRMKKGWSNGVVYKSVHVSS